MIWRLEPIIGVDSAARIVDMASSVDMAADIVDVAFNGAFKPLPLAGLIHHHSMPPLIAGWVYAHTCTVIHHNHCGADHSTVSIVHHHHLTLLFVRRCAPVSRGNLTMLLLRLHLRLANG